MIKSIFYTRFHPEKGSTVLHQVPEGSITPSRSTHHRQPLFHYPSISDFIIPKQDFCDRLSTICVSHYRIIGYPSCICDYSGKYERNQFIFNFALVIEEDLDDWGSYASVVRKLGRLLRALEEQGGFLSKEEDPSWFRDDDENVPAEANGGHFASTSHSAGQNKQSLTLDNESDDDVSMTGSVPKKTLPFSARTGSPKGANSKVYALCEMILEDLNNYYECMIPLDDSNTINLKLFPTRPPPVPVYIWHVPLLTINLSAFSSRNVSSDLTLQRILPYINGIVSVANISRLADTDLGLTRKAIQHLVYYGCAILLDIFQFSAVYAPTAEIGNFVLDESVQEECARYVRIPYPRLASTSAMSTENDINHPYGSIPPPQRRQEPPKVPVPPHQVIDITGHQLIKLYTSLKQGLVLRNWCLDHLDSLAGIDVRRLITFGVIKGFLYRVHKYAIAPTSTHPSPERPEHTSTLPRGDEINRPRQTNATGDDEQQHAPNAPGPGGDLPLEKFLDGAHRFDEICTELQMNERDILAKIKGFGDVQVVHR